MCARYLLPEHELGDREDIDRFAILLGVFTPSLSVVRGKRFSDFRIGFSINDLRAWPDFFSVDFLDDNKADSNFFNVCTCPAGSGTSLPNLGLEHFQPVSKTPIKWMLLLVLQLDQLVNHVNFNPPRKTDLISSPTLKSSQFRSPL